MHLNENRIVFRIFCGILFILMCAGCAGQNQSQDRLEIYNLAHLIGTPDRLKSIIKRVDQGREIIIRIDKGQIIPVKIKLDTPLAVIVDSHDTIRLSFVHDLFLSFKSSGIRVSLDGHDWKEANRIDELKKLMGTEKFSLNIDISGRHGTEGGLVIKLSAL